MKKILMISYPFPPNATAGAVRSERFARYLVQFGWASEVVSIQPRSDLYADAVRLKNLGPDIRTHHTGTMDPWLSLKNYNASNNMSKLLRNIGMEIFNFPDHMLLWVPFAVQKGLQLIQRGRIDAIYSTSPPHSSHLAGLILSRWTGKPWLADFRDPWTLNAYRGKGIVRNKMLQVERIMENAVLKHASVILTNTTANHRNLVEAFPRIDPDKIIHLPNGWEEFPESIEDVPNDSTLTIVHAGTFYPRFKPYALLKAIAEWRRHQKGELSPKKIEASLKVILLGARDASTRNLVKELDLEDLVDIKPWVALEEARRTMRNADLLWVTLGTGKISSTYVPSKIFEYMAAERPILAFFPEGEAAHIIRRTKTGTVFNSDETGPIIKAIVEAMKIKRSGRRLPYDPDQSILEKHHVKSIVGRFASILDRLQEGAA